MTQILGTDAYRTALSESIVGSEDSVTLISAYLTMEGMDWILERLPEKVSCRVLSRWNCSDLVSGASDLEVYEKLKSRGYDLYILLDLHAKVVVVDNSKLFLSSANITNSGLRLVPGGNSEIGTILLPDEQDLALIDVLFEEAALINQTIYEAFSIELKKLKDLVERQPQLKWPSDLLEKLRKPTQRIWVAETLWCNSPEELLHNPDITNNEVAHDIGLLGLNIHEKINRDNLRNSLLKSRIWEWLKYKLLSVPNHEIFYGQLSAELHSAFLDDPKPYRKDVKDLLSNLLNWTTSLCGDRVSVDRPSHSQRIRFCIKP